MTCLHTKLQCAVLTMSECETFVSLKADSGGKTTNIILLRKLFWFPLEIRGSIYVMLVQYLLCTHPRLLPSPPLCFAHTLIVVTQAGVLCKGCDLMQSHCTVISV